MQSEKFRAFEEERERLRRMKQGGADSRLKLDGKGSRLVKEEAKMKEDIKGLK